MPVSPYLFLNAEHQTSEGAFFFMVTVHFRVSPPPPTLLWSLPFLSPFPLWTNLKGFADDTKQVKVFKYMEMALRDYRYCAFGLVSTSI